MDKDWTISAVSPETKPIKTQYGNLVGYYIKLEGEGDPISLNQKPETPAPTVGQKLFGHLEPSPYGMKFKKASQFDSPSQSVASVSSGFTEDDRKMLKEIHKVVTAGMEAEVVLAEKDTVVEDFDDSEPVDLSSLKDIPF